MDTSPSSHPEPDVPYSAGDRRHYPDTGHSAARAHPRTAPRIFAVSIPLIAAHAEPSTAINAKSVPNQQETPRTVMSGAAWVAW